MGEEIIKENNSISSTNCCSDSTKPCCKLNEPYIVFNISGGIGKSIMATAVVTSIKSAYPKSRLIITTAYPEVFINNPKVYRVFKFGNTPYFMEDYVKDDTLILQSDPYLHDSFIHKKKHLVECWCDTFGIKSVTLQPEIYLTSREIQFAKEKFIRNKPLFVIQTNGGADNQGLKYSWARDIPINQAQLVVDELNKTHHVMHIRRPNQLVLRNTEAVSVPLRELFALIFISDKRLFMDSFSEHCAAAFNLPSTVCWVGTNPKIYSYDCHTNITPNDEKKFIHTIDKYLEDAPWSGEKMYECPFDTENLFSVNKIIESIHNQPVNKNAVVLGSNKIPLFQWKHPNQRTNFGDELSKVIVEWISGREVEFVSATHTNKLLAIGSILQNLNDFDTVWGSGKHPFVEANTNVKGVEVNLVRGPITRKYLMDKKINCPEKYADPALLMPLIYSSKVTKLKKIGIIPHFDEIDSFNKNLKVENYEVEVIDVRKPWREIIDSILSCEKVISSSLHGIIVSEAYNIPSVWLKAKYEGEEKYFDYYLGTKRNVIPAKTLVEALSATPSIIPTFDTNLIISSFPAKIGVDRKIAEKYCPSLLENTPREGAETNLQGNTGLNTQITQSIGNFIDNYFDAIYVINLDRRTDRWEEMQTQLKNAGITKVTRISGVVITEKELENIPKEEYAKFRLDAISDKAMFEKRYICGALGVRKAQLNCIRDAKQKGFRKILILEDDVIISPESNRMFSNIINEIGDKWQMLYLGGDYWENNVTFQASSYALDAVLFDFILDGMEKSGEETDFFYVNYVRPGHLVYRATPMLMVQSKKDSDIPTMIKK